MNALRVKRSLPEKGSLYRGGGGRPKRRKGSPHLASVGVEFPERSLDRSFPNIPAWLPPNPAVRFGRTRLTVCCSVMRSLIDFPISRGCARSSYARKSLDPLAGP